MISYSIAKYYTVYIKVQMYIRYVPVGLIIRLICSMFCSSGDSPPCMQNIFSSTIAATGKQLKQSVKVFHSLILYLLLPTLCCKWMFLIEKIVCEIGDDRRLILHHYLPILVYLR